LNEIICLNKTLYTEAYTKFILGMSRLKTETGILDINSFISLELNNRAITFIKKYFVISVTSGTLEF
jgi:hypothetical protein